MGRLAMAALTEGVNTHPSSEVRTRCQSLLPRAAQEELFGGAGFRVAREFDHPPAPLPQGGGNLATEITVRAGDKTGGLGRGGCHAGKSGHFGGQAADAVRGRIDWKYALALELTDPGFDHTVLSEFRSRLVKGKTELLLLDILLERFKELDLLRTRGRQRTDSTYVIAAVRSLNRLERVAETLRAALNT